MGDSSPDLDHDVASALADADALVRDGRGSEAIRLLTEANRVHRHPQTEERLVALRQEAFPSWSESAGQPPEEIVPEPNWLPLAPTDPRELDVAALRRGLARHGCLLVPGLITPERAEALARGVDRALDAFDTCTAASGPKAVSPWYVPFTPRTGDYRVGGRRRWVRASGALWTADSPRMLFDLLEVVHETGVGSLVEAYLGERPALSANKCTLRRVPVDTRTDWHQDGAFLGRHVRTLNLWLALSPCGTDAPGLDIVPRRFNEVLDTGTDGAFFDWSVSPEVVERAADGVGVIRPEFAPGDALLFDHLFLHRTGVAPGMSRERWAIETWFFAPSSYPDGQIPIAY
jgi:Phytanoyl-CoA dioxygenase (PhyH)